MAHHLITTTGRRSTAIQDGGPKISSRFSRRYAPCDFPCRDLVIDVAICQTETYQVAPGKATHGYSGPLKVSYGGAFSNIGQEFLEVGAQYDKTRGKLDDPNSLFDINGYGVRFLHPPFLCALVSRLMSTRSRGGKSTSFHMQWSLTPLLTLFHPPFEFVT